MRELQTLIAELIGGDDGRAEAAAVALGQIGGAALPKLQALLNSKKVDDRWWGMRAIAAMDQPPVGILAAGLQDGAAEVRAASALALATHPSAEAVGGLVSGLGDEDDLVSTLCVQALVRLGSKCVRDLLAALPSAGSRRRVQIMRALAGLKDVQAIGAMLRATEDDSAIVRYWADKGLDALGLGMVYMMPD